jgi:tetratricopeptide (TPR) repeat protein
VRIPGKNGVVVLLDNTNQGQYLDRIVNGIMDILYDQPYEGPRRSIAETLHDTIGEKGIDAAVTQYRDLKANKANDYDFNEGELNTLGYQLLRDGKKREAIEIFKLNVEAFPKGWNTYDSLGEAYMVNGDKENAIANYKKSLELNPANDSAKRGLALLTVDRKEVTLDPKLYDAYAGDYELAPNFVLTISNEDGKLMGQAPGQPKAELFPTSETEFFLKVVDAQITFVKNGDGKVTQLILHQNGRNMDAKKIK